MHACISVSTQCACRTFAILIDILASTVACLGLFSFYPNRFKLIYGQAFYSNSDTALLILPGPLIWQWCTVSKIISMKVFISPGSAEDRFRGHHTDDPENRTQRTVVWRTSLRVLCLHKFINQQKEATQDFRWHPEIIHSCCQYDPCIKQNIYFDIYI